MTELLQALFDYALDRQSLCSIHDQRQYKESRKMCEQSYQKLQALLSDEGKECLENYIGEVELLHGLDTESIFRTGLAIGLELSRI